MQNGKKWNGLGLMLVMGVSLIAALPMLPTSARASMGGGSDIDCDACDTEPNSLACERCRSGQWRNMPGSGGTVHIPGTPSTPITVPINPVVPDPSAARCLDKSSEGCLSPDDYEQIKSKCISEKPSGSVVLNPADCSRIKGTPGMLFGITYDVSANCVYRLDNGYETKRHIDTTTSYNSCK